MIQEESRITTTKFKIDLCYEIWDRVELLPYNDLNDLVQMFIGVKQ